MRGEKHSHDLRLPQFANRKLIKIAKTILLKTIILFIVALPLQI